MPDTNAREFFIKVDNGLVKAGVKESERKWVTDTFLALPGLKQQEIIMSVGSFGLFASDAEKEKRDLWRAMCVGLALHQGPKSGFDRDWREQILKKLDLLAARNVVRDQVKKACAAEETNENTGVLNLPAPEVVMHMPQPRLIVAHANPVSAQVDKPGPGWKMAREKIFQPIKENRRAEAFVTALKEEQAARPARAEAFARGQAGDYGVVWSTARATVSAAIDDLSMKNLHNMTTFTTELRFAYARYGKHVKDTQELLKGKIDVAKKVFEAMKMAGPPLSFIGAFGSAVAGQVKVQAGLDEGCRFAILTKQKTPTGFFSNLVKRFDDLRAEKLRVGPDLTKFASEMSLHVQLNELYKERMKEMEYALRKACEDHFASTSDVLQRLRTFVGDQAKENSASVIGRIGAKGDTSRDAKGAVVQGAPPIGQVNLDMLISQKITEYQNELLKEMEPAIKLPKLFPPEEAGYAIEMLLYCEYIMALYDKKRYFGKPIAPGISNFFSRAKPWGVLMPGVKHEQAVLAKRLMWKDTTDRKKTLVMFCNWYFENINPFMLITGGMRKGEIYTAALIERLCKEQIDKINAAVNAGRKEGMFRTTWDWDVINVRYARSNQAP